MNVSIYQNAQTPKPIKDVSLTDALGYIRDGYHVLVSTSINRLRSETDKKKRNELKKQLPAVTWSGAFTTRNKNNLIKHSNIICIDLDELENVQDTKNEFIRDSYTRACFISPSGNGLKVLYVVNIFAFTHLELFNAIATYITNEYGIQVDESGKDVSRLCFLSLDTDLFENDKSEIISHDFVARHTTTQNTANTKQLPKTSNTNAISIEDKINEIVCKTVKPSKGNFNEYINLYALQANRYGLSQNACANAIANFCAFPKPNAADVAVIKSVYSKFAHESNKYNIEKNTKKITPPPAVNFTGRVNKIYNTQTLFWYVLTNAKTGIEEIKFSYDDAITFLQNNGFFKYRIDKGKYSLIRVDVHNKIIDIVNELQVKEFFINFLLHQHEAIDAASLKAVREMFRRGAKNYCSANLLEGLNYYEPNFKKDTQTTAYVYFKNCFLKITKDGAEPQEYKHLDGFIWEKQIIDFNYTKVDYVDFDFTKFLIYCITGSKQSYQELHTLPQEATDLKKFNSLLTSLGYMIHNYKNPAITKAVVAVDSQKRTQGESNGRSGKTLISKAIAKMANMCLIDGKNFKFDYEFAFDRVNADTKFLNFNDVTKNFDFERLFGLITEDFIYSKKKLDSITIPFSDSPKIYVSTNYTLKGDGESMLGRQQIIEVSNFFTSTNQPIDVFGKMFFNDWNENDYNQFYSLFCDCIRLYLDQGLIKFPLENYDINKLIDTAGETFIEYMQDTVLEQLQFKNEYELKQLYETYKSNNNLTHLQQRSFSKYIEMWAKVNNILINEHKQGARDHRNGITYLTFTSTNTAATITTNTDLI